MIAPSEWFSHYTVNVNFVVQYICSRISRRALDAQKFDVSENYNHNRINRIKWDVRKTLTTRICLLGLDAPKFSCAYISMFTVIV